MSNTNTTLNKEVSELEASALKSKLLLDLYGCLSYLLPKGEFKKDKFYVGNVRGDPGQSLIVELKGEKAGQWHDFETGDGGDIISLWAAVLGRDTKGQFPKVLRSIACWLGESDRIDSSGRALHNKKKINDSIEKQRDFDDVTVVYDADAKDSLGSLNSCWDYLDEKCELIARIYRYDTAAGKKYRPWDAKTGSFCAPNPRPLYNIPGILKSDRVVLVEGEKCAEVLIKDGIVATTAMFGANAPIDKTDWSPLVGKHVIIWPDNDEPGKRYAKKVAEGLAKVGVLSTSIIDIPKEYEAGWDAADAKALGLDLKEFCETASKVSIKPHHTSCVQAIKPSSWKGSPPMREWIIKSWIPKGYVTAIYGDGGVGKSLLAQQLMTVLATGKSWLGDEQLAPMPVYGLFCEDDINELWRRQYAINKQLNLEMHDIDNMCFVSRVGENNLLMVFDGKDTGELTSFFYELLADIEDFKPKLVVLDTAADLFGGNENNRSHVRQFIQNCCGRIAKAIDGAVLLCAHPSDSGIQRKTGTGGSTAWNNTVRSRLYLSNTDEAASAPEMRILSRKKSNYAAAAGSKDQVGLKWERGMFVPLDNCLYSERKFNDSYGKKLDAERLRKDDVILKVIASEAMKGRVYTSAQFAEQFEGKSGLGGVRSIRERISCLASTGYIKYFKNIEKYGITSSKSSCGFLCVEGMKLLVGTHIDSSTGETIKQYHFVRPTHYRSKADGRLLEAEDASDARDPNDSNTCIIDEC